MFPASVMGSFTARAPGAHFKQHSFILRQKQSQLVKNI